MYPSGYSSLPCTICRISSPILNSLPNVQFSIFFVCTGYLWFFSIYDRISPRKWDWMHKVTFHNFQISYKILSLWRDIQVSPHTSVIFECLTGNITPCFTFPLFFFSFLTLPPCVQNIPFTHNLCHDTNCYILALCTSNFSFQLWIHISQILSAPRMLVLKDCTPQTF